MKKILCIFVISIIMISFSVSNELKTTKGDLSANNLSIFTDIDFGDALIKAKKENKLIMLFIHEEGGPWCSRMREGAFKDKDVLELLNENYISVDLDRYEDIVPKEYYTGFVPVVYLVDPHSKKILKSSIGYTEAMSLADKLEETSEFRDE